MQRATAVGYVAAFSIERRPVTRAENRMALPRYIVTDADRGARFEVLLGGGDEVCFGRNFGSLPRSWWHLPPTPRSGKVSSSMQLPTCRSQARSSRSVARPCAPMNRVKYRVADAAQPLQVRAAGYRREAIAPADGPLTIRLTPLTPKALYLTVYGIGAPFLRDPALEVIERSGLNALVIDLKGDRGYIPYPSALPLAAKNGALSLRTIPDLKELATTLKGRGIYLIARIVVFKDDPLVKTHPEWAVRTAGGAIWKDREGLSWIDPYRKEAWDYTLGVAEEAAAAGFDEIQFDYVRFPDALGLAFAQASQRSVARRSDHWLPTRGAAAADALQCLHCDRCLRLCVLEPRRHRHWPAARGPGVGGGLHLAHALSVELPVRHSRGPQSRGEPLRDRPSIAPGGEGQDVRNGSTIPALAAGVHRLCLWRTEIWRRRDRQTN